MNGKAMKVYVGCKTREDPFNYRLVPGDRLCACYDWVSYGTHIELDMDEDACQMAADGDGRAQRFIEGIARRSITQRLIRDLKQVIGPNWSRCLEVLIEREYMKEAKHDGG